MASAEAPEQERMTLRVTATNPRPTSSNRNTSRPVVHARPLAVAAVNTATIAGASLYAATGAAGLLVAGGVVATGAAAVAARKARANHRETGSMMRSSSVKTTGGARSGGHGLPKLGRSAGGSPPGGPGRAGGSTPKGTGGRKPGSGLGLPKLGRSSGGAPGTHRAKPNGKGSTGSHKPSRGVGQGLRDFARAIKDGATKGTAPRQAGKVARDSMRQSGRPATWRGRLGRWIGGLIAGALAATWVGVKNGARRLRRRFESPTVEQAEPKPAVTDTVREPATQQEQQTYADDQPVPQPQPGPAYVEPSPTMPEGGTVSHKQLLELSEQMIAVASRHEPVGMLEVVRGYHALPEIMENVARALRISQQKAQERYPVSTSVLDTLTAMHNAQMAVARVAADVGPAIEGKHKDELDRLRNPRPGEAMWDVRANQDAA